MRRAEARYSVDFRKHEVGKLYVFPRRVRRGGSRRTALWVQTISGGQGRAGDEGATNVEETLQYPAGLENLRRGFKPHVQLKA